jgi:hypothetical protein
LEAHADDQSAPRYMNRKGRGNRTTCPKVANLDTCRFFVHVPTSGLSTTHPDWYKMRPSRYSGRFFTALQHAKNHPLNVATGAFFDVTYATCTCSMVPLNLNDTLSK